MASLLIACFLASIDFCFQSWYHKWCSDFLMVYLIRFVLYADTWTVTQKCQILGMIFLTALQDFFVYGIFGFRLVWIIPFLVGVWSLANLFRYRLFLLSSLLVLGMIVLQGTVALFLLGMHETLYGCGVRLMYSILFMLFSDLINVIKITLCKKTLTEGV